MSLSRPSAKNTLSELTPFRSDAGGEDGNESNGFQVQQLTATCDGVKSWALKRFPHQIFHEIQNAR